MRRLSIFFDRICSFLFELNGALFSDRVASSFGQVHRDRVPHPLPIPVHHVQLPACGDGRLDRLPPPDGAGSLHQGNQLDCLKLCSNFKFIQILTALLQVTIKCADWSEANQFS